MTPIPQSASSGSPNANLAQQRSPRRFFLLVFLLSVPFAVAGSVTAIQLLPGIPISALGFICPVTAAAILAYRENGFHAVTELLRRSFDYGRIRSRIWYAPIVLMMPAIATLAYVLMRDWNLPLPVSQFSALRIVILLIVFFLAALGEELGWSGYAIDPMQRRWSALHASLVLGAVWAVWHIIAMIQAGQSAASIAWGCLDMVGTRVIMVWLYNNTGRSVFAVALYHTVANVTTKSLFPGGSYDAERIMSITIAITAVVIAIAWGPRTLTRHQSS